MLMMTVAQMVEEYYDLQRRILDHTSHQPCYGGSCECFNPQVFEYVEPYADTPFAITHGICLDCGGNISDQG